MDFKKIGIWSAGFIGSFLVLMLAAYFLFPYLNPKKAEKVESKNEIVQNASFDPSEYSLQAIDSLNNQIITLQNVIDSLRKEDSSHQKLLDSLKKELESTVQEESGTEPAINKNLNNISITETAKSLLSLEEGELAPIVDLLDESQLLNLYMEASTRQRKKLLRTLKPKKAATILKKVMK
ncbi:MAG TPA: hypothetical protein VK106_06685 [Balneolaceae bacterium]|nr:hypothetical protein [Balneolaceae bacterium]